MSGPDLPTTWVMPPDQGPALSRFGPLRALTTWLPRGQTLPDELWDSRHRALLRLLWIHVPVLIAFALLRGHPVVVSIGAVVPIVLAGTIAGLRTVGRRARSVALVVGLLTASAVLVKAWDGQIEAHFHFFVMVVVIALYEDWLPFGVAIAYVLTEHGVLGAVQPEAVYNHGGNPWAWAAVHGGFILATVVASVVTWRLNEQLREQLRSTDDSLRLSSERFRLAFESGASGMAMSSPDGRYFRVNRALCSMLGYSEAELLGLDWRSLTHPDDLALELERHQALADGTIDVHETETRYLHRDGHAVWVQVAVTVVRDEAGTAEYYIVQSHDVTERHRAQTELAHQALHDPLTGLPNRVVFADRTEQALRRLRRQHGRIAVLFIDMDRFKLVNDDMGHAVGDAVLIEAGRRLCAAARAEDTVARIGGDEFTILCENLDEGNVTLVAQRVVDAFSRPFTAQGREFYMSASVGVCATDSAHTTLDEMLCDADVALYGAKQHGRGRFEVFAPTANGERVDRFGIERALRTALREGQLVLHYQPIVDLDSGRTCAVEALVRWQHPERGLVPPGDFIAVAEESGLIVEIGAWVLREACAQFGLWRKTIAIHPDLRMAVNVAARQLADPAFVGLVAEASATSGLEPAALCLEITESAAIQDTAVVRETLRALTAMGVSIALDDFGVGFSSLDHIRSLPPVDVIKIDRSFIAGLRESDADRAVVTTVLGLAAALGSTAVAEGIESEDQLALLRTMGCKVGQGFHFARPLAAEAIVPLLQLTGALTTPGGGVRA